MTTAGRAHSFAEIVVDVVFPPDPAERTSVEQLSRPQKAAALSCLQKRRAMLAAEAADLILGLAEDTPDDDDPPPDHPGGEEARLDAGM
jgi:hypothetical protein